MNPARLQVHEDERHVGNIRECEEEHVVVQGEQKNIERQIRPHGAGRRAVLVGLREIFRQEAILRGLKERAGGTCDRSHHREQQCCKQHHDDNVHAPALEPDHMRHRKPNPGAGIDAGVQHAGEAQRALEG